MTATLSIPETIAASVERETILDHLAAFIRQRPGLEYGNYASGWNDASGRAAYFSEMRSITRDLHDARELLGAVYQRQSITADHLRESFRAFSGRLTWARNVKVSAREIIRTVRATDAAEALKEGRKYFAADVKDAEIKIVSLGNWSLDYCTGQYFPTEYRKAVCAVLASALWGYFRANIAESMTEDGPDGQKYAGPVKALRGMSYGDAIRATARRELSRGVARRWFN